MDRPSPRPRPRMPAPLPRETLAKLGALAGGAAWGAFWVPVRALERAGLEGFWPVAVLMLATLVSVLPLLALRWRRILAGGWYLQAAGFLTGGAMALYSGAFLYTQVVPAVLLYYLSPVWGFLLARLWLGDPITVHRWVAMVLALTGAAVVFGVDTWPPRPRNVGDWIALASGLLFVIGSMLMLARPRHSSVEYCLAFFIWAGVIGLGIALLQPVAAPALAQIVATAHWLIPVVLLLLTPAIFAAIYGASALNPGLVGILYMAEIGVSLVLAAILTDEPIGPNQILGVAMIALAGALEGLLGVVRRAMRGVP